MSNEVNIQKMYQFIASFEKKGGWENVADGYGSGKKDGTVIKSEFRAFVNGEFANWNGNEGGTVSSDIINDFWKAIDTNTSASKIAGTKLKNLNALDKNELAAMEKRLEAYIAFDEFVAKNVKIPTEVLLTTGSQWKRDVVDDLAVLVEEYINNGFEGDLNSILATALPGIANQNTAEYCAIEYQQALKNTILAEYPEYDVTNDATLNNLLSQYLETKVTGETAVGDIKKDIRAIMDAYLKTAGLGEGSNYDLSSLGFNKDAINGIQVAVITQNIKNALKNEAKNYEGFEEYFNEAVQKFIDFKLQSGGNFDSLKNCASEFLSSTFKQELDKLVNFEKTFRDVTEGSDFHKKLVERYGKTVADLIATDDRYLNAYKEIVNNALAQIREGSLDFEKAEDYILSEIGNHINEFFSNGFADLKTSELINLYDKRVDAAHLEKDDEKSLAQHRQAAIDFCDALAKKGDAYKEAVVSAFGKNWADKINSLTPGQIKPLMDDLKAKIREIGDIEDYKCTWNGAENRSLLINSTTSFTVGANMTTGNNSSVDMSKVTYSAKISGAGTGHINPSTGEITVTTGSAKGNITIEVRAMFNGQPVGEPTTITIEVKDMQGVIESAGAVKDKYTGGELKVYNNGKTKNGQQINNLNFSELYSNDAVIQLHYLKKRSGKNQWSDNKAIVLTRLKDLGSIIVDSLAAQGLNENKLKQAMQTVANRWVDAGVKRYNHRNSDISSETAATIQASSGEYRNGIVEGHDNYSTDKNSYQVSFKDFVDAIIAEYNSL